jgi:hypothetical protein
MIDELVTPLVLNRRYRRLQALLDADDYFSEEAIRMREV